MFFVHMNWRQFAGSYLSFSKKDRIGIFIILIIIVTIYLLPRLFAKKEPISLIEDKELYAIADTLNTKQTKEYEKDESATGFQYEPSITNDFSKGELFQFDPNSLSPPGWRKLGLNEKAIATISNYRNKGGKFYKPSDLNKIWGLPKGFYDRVESYITISNSRNENEQKFTADKYVKTERKTWNIELNTTDTSALIELPGIGSKLAMRIINFRDKLGGFYSPEQVRETFGLADSTFEKIKLYLHINVPAKKINVNTATKDELKLHPYIKWNLANAIVEYKNQHGNFKSIDDLKNILIIDEATLHKLSHYLAF